MGIDSLLIAGVVVNVRVDNVARNAADRGCNSIFREDGCANLEREAHKTTLCSVAGLFGKIMTRK